MTIEDLDKQSSGTRFMQFKSGWINWKNTQNLIKLPSAIYALTGLTDELASARYARFINKRFSELRAEQFEKILEEARDLEARWELEEL